MIYYQYEPSKTTRQRYLNSAIKSKPDSRLKLGQDHFKFIVYPNIIIYIMKLKKGMPSFQKKYGHQN